MHEFETGAKRDGIAPRYDLIPTVALRRLAERYAMGAQKYGEFNWQKGLPWEDVFNHILDHLNTWRDRHRQDQVPSALLDDDLAGAMWGICTLMWQEQQSAMNAAQQLANSTLGSGGQQSYDPRKKA